jgi:hypothetical protein
MKGKTLAAVLLAALIQPAVAQAANADLTTFKNSELCVSYYMTLITGAATYEASQDELTAEIERRGEGCVPVEVYMAAATERVRRLDAISMQAQQAEQQAAIDDDLERRERQERMLRTLQVINQQYQKPVQTPQRTTCRPDGIGGVTCTSW